MRAQDIKVGHIYYVDFDPVRRGEFDRHHLAVVMKKNADEITFIAIPMTSRERGIGVNKIDLGHIDTLPENLRENISYAVIDQVRTINSSRFYALKDSNGEYVDVIMPEEKLIKLYKAVIRDFLHDVPPEDLLKILI